ncbi:hypothetical protein DESUT3_10920 [Desulfuromonas versatilis]|uniref:PatA-like N-terminal domain-containing protein n=1 Tax=Desulfuromonas versatilis TaxID=2802975 RepID=A0ABN6DV73_9BACT|nr:DUF4388 domain-containing protein [Desulfuromonas versatilis]BCR04023.1 hypothetical protein DESUT3_10920 [Desulfuromonas versatilis]
MSKLNIDSNGRLPLPHRVARELGKNPLEVKSLSPAHLLLTTEASGEELVLAGSLGGVEVADLLSFFNMFRKTGVLSFAFGGGGKDLYFQNGEIIFAASSFPEEDLGEILCGLAKIDRDTLLRLRSLITARNSIGKVLVEKGAVTPKDLWLATRQQVETIIYNLFAHHQGSYFFVSKSLEGEEIVRLSMSTQNMIMEGLRRVDERALFMRRIGSLEAVPVPGDKPVQDGLPALAKRMMLVIREGRFDAREVLRKSGVEEFEGLRALHQLLEKGAVRMEDAPAVALDGELGKVLSVFNGALVALFARVAARHAGFGEEMRIFMRDLPQPFSYVFRDVALREDGSVDGGRILRNLAGLEEGDKKKLLAEALSELVFAECALARRELGVEGSAELVQRVQEVTRRVKNLIGRQS